jgi:cytidylate kinase
MQTILVINSKGGSGKTTLTTNLASYYASKKIRTREPFPCAVRMHGFLWTPKS